MSSLQEEHWHHLTHDDVVSQLDTDPHTGLASDTVDSRQQQYGPNALTQRKGQGPLIRFLLQFNQALVYILLAAVIIKLLLGAWVDASVIFGVVLLNSIIGFLQESKALNALDALSRAMVTETTVLRDGEKQRIDARSLVPGDVVLLASGDKVPADLKPPIEAAAQLTTEQSLDYFYGADMQAMEHIAVAATRSARSAPNS